MSEDESPVAGPSEPAAQSVRLRTSDGVELDGDLAVVEGAWAGAVVCHPHPAYGGDRHNLVVDSIFRTLAGAGMTVLRFDFRAGSDGRSGEEHDVAAGLGEVAQRLEPGRPLWLMGYSFGAEVALSVADERVAGWVAVAPPLRFGAPPQAANGDPRPVLVVAAEHDQFSGPDRLQDATSAWPDATVAVVPGADHFLVGASTRVADTVLAWLPKSAGWVSSSRPGGEPWPST